MPYSSRASGECLYPLNVTSKILNLHHPQGLPVSFALSLTVIARRMAKRSVLVKNLANIETLGCISVLCSDKTGTLTAGKMVSRINVLRKRF